MLKNTNKNYGVAFKLFHWSIAVGCIALFFLGIYMVTLNYYHPYYHQSLTWHKSLGIVVAMIWLMQMIWWPLNPPPHLDKGSPWWQRITAKLVHIGLLLSVLILSITGYLIATSSGDGVDVWHFFTVPSGFETKEPWLSVFGEVHEYTAYSMAGLFILHVAGVIFHHIKGDKIIKRML